LPELKQRPVFEIRRDRERATADSGLALWQATMTDDPHEAKEWKRKKKMISDWKCHFALLSATGS
jgi:hypothetical protein